MSSLSDKQIKKIKERDKARKKELKQEGKQWKSSAMQQRSPAGYQRYLDSVQSYKDNKYKPEPKKKKKSDGIDYDGFEAREFNTEVPKWEMQYQDTSEIDGEYSIDRLEKQVNRLEDNYQKPQGLKSLTSNLMGRISTANKLPKNKGMNKEMRKTRKEYDKLSRFNPSLKDLKPKYSTKRSLGPSGKGVTNKKKLNKSDKKIFGTNPRPNLTKR